MSNLLDIARRALANRPPSGESEPGEKGDKGGKPLSERPLPPLSPFSRPDAQQEIAPAVILTGLRPWKRAEALRLMAAADELPAALGVSGLHSAVQAAAAMVVSAYQTRDMETLCFAVAEFEAVVRAARQLHSRDGLVSRVES